MPAALLRRRLSVWLQQGVLREEPAGTFSVVEEERPQDRDNMVLVDSDDESDSGLASQADQKEEELLVRPARPRGRGAGVGRGGLTAAVPPALLDVHPGHADQPGEPVAGAHLQHAAHVRGHRPRAGRDRLAGAPGLPAEEGARPAARLFRRRLPPAQELWLSRRQAPPAPPQNASKEMVLHAPCRVSSVAPGTRAQALPAPPTLGVCSGSAHLASSHPGRAGPPSRWGLHTCVGSRPGGVLAHECPVTVANENPRQARGSGQ